MENKPLIVFAVFMAAALVIIAAFLGSNDPYKRVGKGQTRQSGVRSATVLYAHNCASCHGTTGQGQNGYPSLQKTNLTEEQIAQVIINGRGEMPAFPHFSSEDVSNLARLVKQF
jgi:mono/diheme cytochrome c family protein